MFVKQAEKFEKNLTDGDYTAHCFAVIDLGRQWTEFEGQGKFVRQVALGFRILEGNRFWLILTASLHEKAKLRAYLESWRGRPFTEKELNGFDLNTILGVPVLLTLTEKNGYLNITKLKKPVKEVVSLEEGIAFVYDAQNEANFSRCPKWIQEKILNQDIGPSSGETGADVPF